MLAHVDSAELTEWIAYEQITGPLGSTRDDIHAGIIAATIYNANRGKNQRALKPDSFIPKWDKQKPQTWQDQLAAIREANKALGGTESGRTAPLD